jgi:arsenate reductase
MPLTIYHNPRCSKSRQTLKLLHDAGTEPRTVLYLTEPPDPARIVQLASYLGVPVLAITRQKEDVFTHATDLPELGDDAALAAWIARHPGALERPIVVDDERGAAVIGRPPENVLGLLGG